MARPPGPCSKGEGALATSDALGRPTRKGGRRLIFEVRWWATFSLVICTIRQLGGGGDWKTVFSRRDAEGQRRRGGGEGGGYSNGSNAAARTWMAWKGMGIYRDGGRGGGVLIGGMAKPPWVLHNPVARREGAGFPMIGNKVSNGWKNPDGGPSGWKRSSGRFVKQMEQRGNKLGGEHGESVNMTGSDNGGLH